MGAVSAALVVAPVALLPDAASAAASAPTSVICGGTGSLLETGLQSVGGAGLIDHTPLASAGPNLVLNGDFTFAVDGTDMASARARAGLVPGTTVGGVPQALRDWTATGGGARTYAKWGYAVGNGEPPPAPADASMVYFGNALDAKWRQDSGTVVHAENGFRNPLGFDANGAALSNITVTPRDNSADYYGTPATPVALTQTVDGLVPGDRYRLQFWATGEDRTAARYVDPGLFAIDVTGYHRVYLTVPPTSRYVTLDFIATSSSTQLAFLSWGHTNPVNGGTDPTELILDDVILAQCATAGGLTAPPSPVAALGSNPPWAVDDPYYTPYETTLTSGDVQLRDTVPGGATVRKLTDPAHGTLTWNSDGTFAYNPDPGFVGTDSFTYELCSIFCLTATEHITVGPPPASIAAVNDAYSTALNTPMTAGTAAARDFYPSGSTFIQLTDPANGSVAWNNDGRFTYTPANGFTGTDTFDYQVCVPATTGAADSPLTPRQLAGPQTVEDVFTYADTAGFGMHTAWFTLTPTASGTLTLDTFDSTYDTRLWLTDDAGTVLAHDDDALGAPPWTSRLSYAVTANRTYLVAVGGYTLNGWPYNVAPGSVLRLKASGVLLRGCAMATETITVTGPAAQPEVVPERQQTSNAAWTLSYLGQGGACSTPWRTVPDGTVVTVGDGATTCSRPGHAFTGWANTPGGEPSVPAGTPYTMTGNVTLYATWRSGGPDGPSRPRTPPFERDFGVTSRPAVHVFRPLTAFTPSNGASTVRASLTIAKLHSAAWRGSVAVPGKGTFVVRKGAVVFTGVPGWSGTVSIRYRAMDSARKWAASTLTVRVARVPGSIDSGR